MTDGLPKIFSEQAEEAYLAGLLINPHELEQHPLRVEDFYIHRYRFIFEAILQCKNEHGVFDIVLLTQQLKKNGTYNDVGGTAGIAKIMNSEASSLNTGAYAKEIKKLSENRQMAQVFSKAYKSAFDGSLNPSFVIQEITKTIRAEGHQSDMGEVGQRYKEYIQEREDNPSDIWGIQTPWKQFNDVTGGLHNGECTMFYGPSNLGKTTIVLQICLEAAILKHKVHVYELEMKDIKLLERLAAIYAKIPTRKVHRGRLTPEEKRKLFTAIDYITGLPITVSDSTHWESLEIRADQVRRGSDRADIVIVDYLALLKDKAESEHMRVEIGAKNLRDMAKDLWIPVVTVASQIKDGTIKGTGEVEYAQDEVWKISRLNPENLQDRNRILTPTKRRNDGRIEKVQLVMLDGLPMFGDVYKGEDAQSLPYYHK